MGLFEGMLKDNESIFKNDIALDFSFQPKLLLHRENEQFFIANCIKPLFQQRSGRNVLLHGKPGIGKTVAVKHVFNELEEQYDEIIPLYINCWQKNTTYKIAVELCEKLDYKFIQNKKTQDLFKEIKNRLNKTNCVIAFDEVDKVEDFDFLYTILEDIYRKTIILISTYREWLINLDQRIKSRLNPEILSFKEYNMQETRDILAQRKDYAFHSNVLPTDSFEIIAAKTFETKDMRTGLHLMKEAGFIAENESSRTIRIDHVKKAIEKLDHLSTKSNLELEEDAEFILNIIKLNSGKKIGDLFKIYQENKGPSSYKTFVRRISRLKDGKFITVKTISGGTGGSTSIITYQSIKKLTEF